MAEPVAPLDRAAERLASAGRTVRWFWRGVTGEDAYDRYVEHLRTTHPGCPVPSERDFWRDKWADAEKNPKSRCC